MPAQWPPRDDYSMCGAVAFAFGSGIAKANDACGPFEYYSLEYGTCVPNSAPSPYFPILGHPWYTYRQGIPVPPNAIWLRGSYSIPAVLTGNDPSITPADRTRISLRPDSFPYAFPYLPANPQPVTGQYCRGGEYYDPHGVCQLYPPTNIRPYYPW